MQDTRKVFMEICEWGRGDGGESCVLRLSVHRASRLGMTSAPSSKDRAWEILTGPYRMNVKFLNNCCCNSNRENVLMQIKNQH